MWSPGFFAPGFFAPGFFDPAVLAPPGPAGRMFAPGYITPGYLRPGYFGADVTVGAAAAIDTAFFLMGAIRPGGAPAAPWVPTSAFASTSVIASGWPAWAAGTSARA